MMDSLVFFILVIAITVKSVSEEIQNVWHVSLGNARKAYINALMGFWCLFHKVAFLCAEK